MMDMLKEIWTQLHDSLSFLFFSHIKRLKWRMPPIAMATGYSLVVSNRFPVTSCVTHATLVTQVIHTSVQVTSDTCGAHPPRSQGLSSLPPLVVGRKTLVAAGHVTTCDTNYSTGVESTNNFCGSQLAEAKERSWNELHLWHFPVVL